MSISVRTEEVQSLTDAELVETIENKLGGKELSESFAKLVIETHHLLRTTQQKVENIYPVARSEGFSKEEAKTIVATLLGVSVRTVNRYIEDKDKDVELANREIKAKALKNKEVTTIEGTYDQDGLHGKPSDLRESGQLKDESPDVITDTKVHQPTENLEDTIKRLSKPFKTDLDITIQGRTFIIHAKADPTTREITAEYSEKQIIKILQGKANN